MTRQRTRIAALVAGCAIVAGGAYAATDALSSSNPAPAAAAADQQPGAASSASSAQPAQAAALSSAITEIDTPASTAASTPAQRSVQLRRARRALRRLRQLGGEHGEFTFHTKQGNRTLAFERGTIVSVAGSDVTVRAADNTTWTWALTSSSVVRDDGSRASASALSAGETVFTGGPVTGATRDARLIVVRESASAKSAS